MKLSRLSKIPYSKFLYPVILDHPPLHYCYTLHPNPVRAEFDEEVWCSAVVCSNDNARYFRAA